MQTAAKAQNDKANLEAKQKIEGLRIGADIGKSKQQMQNTKNANDVRVLSELVKQKKEHQHQNEQSKNEPKQPKE